MKMNDNRHTSFQLHLRHDLGDEGFDLPRRRNLGQVLVLLFNLVGLEGEEREEVSEARRRNLHVPLLHAKVELLEQHRVLFDILMSMLRVSAVGVIGEDFAHELTDAHIKKLRDFLDHNLSVDLILWLIELKLSLLFLSVEHDSAGVGEALLHAILQLVMLVVRMVLVMLRAI